METTQMDTEKQILLLDDTGDLLDLAIESLRTNLEAVKTHMKDEEIKKASCSVSIEFRRNKDGEIVTKLNPTVDLPQKVQEWTCEIHDDNHITLI